MPTENTIIQSDTGWTLAATETDTPLLIQCTIGIPWEVAVVDGGDAAPDEDLTGHLLEGKDQLISRNEIGAGDVYIRTLDRDIGEVKFVVTFTDTA